jgi:predicted transcriptional regulator
MAQSATTIYLDESQRKKLFKLAAARNSSFSSEIRTAIDRYVEQAEVGFSEEEAQLLIHQAK